MKTKIASSTHNAKAFLCSALMAIASPVMGQSKVTVATVADWNKGEKQQIFCSVTTPGNYVISSHSASELLWVLPEGATVEKGDLVATQDDFYLKSSIKSYELDMQRARANLLYTEKELSRLQALGNTDYISQSQLFAMQRDYKVAEVDIKQAENDLAVANFQLKRLNHLAPTKGSVVKSSVEIGRRLEVGSEVLTIAPTAKKELTCRFPYELLQIFMPIESAVYTLKGAAIELSRVSETMENSSQVLNIYFSLSEDSELIIGQRVEVSASKINPRLTRVAYDAVNIASDNFTVLKVNEQNIVELVAVAVISSTATYFVVESDLKAGDRVVVRGKGRAAPGEEVNVIEDSSL